MGRRIRKVAYAWDDVAEDWETAPDMDLRFVYDGWNLVQEIDGLVEVESGVTDVTREYTWGLDLSGQGGNPSPAGIHGAGGIGGLLATHWTSNTTSTSDDKAYIYFYDANGNVGQMIESTGSGAGTVAAKYEYYPFGGLLVADGVAAEANPFRFSTKYRDNETGCYYYGYRYLRTKHGRWLSRELIDELEEPNLAVDATKCDLGKSFNVQFGPQYFPLAAGKLVSYPSWTSPVFEGAETVECSKCDCLYKLHNRNYNANYLLVGPNSNSALNDTISDCGLTLPKLKTPRAFFWGLTTDPGKDTQGR